MLAMIERARSLSASARWSSLAAVCLLGLVLMALLPPIPQPLEYHNFADQRTMAGIPHAWDVFSNLAFLLSGSLGLWFVVRARTLDAGTRFAFGALFFGLVLTSIGSAYYHWQPDNQRLVFDRLPMIFAMAGCTGALLADRFGGKTAWIITALLATGLWTVHYWNVGEQAGHGDLRWYLLFQGLTIIAGALLLVFFPSRNKTTFAFTIAVIGNVLAKIFELLDKPVYALGGAVSGHTLKHLSAGLAFLPVAFAVRRFAKNRITSEAKKMDLSAAGSR
jgi:hypothetical protein